MPWTENAPCVCSVRPLTSPTLNILIINYEFPPIGGGAATATKELARALQSAGNTVTVLTAGMSPLVGESMEFGVRIRRLRSRRSRPDRSSFYEKLSFVIHAAVSIVSERGRLKPEGSIVFFSLPCGPLGRLVKAVKGCPYVISLRGGDVPGTERALDRIHRVLLPVRRWVLRGATAVVANSPGLKELSESADPLEVTVIPNGVDTVAFTPKGRLPDGMFRFLFVGRLTSQKNVALLLEAANIVQRASKVPFLIEIVGEGPLEKDLRAQSLRLGIDGIVRWKRWLAREEMPGCYASADCLVNPSRYEGMPNTVLEAMACALPVVVSDVAGNRDTVERNVSGLIVTDNDPVALADAMRSLLEDQASAAAMGLAARKRVSERFSWEAAALAYMKVFDRPDGVSHRAAV